MVFDTSVDYLIDGKTVQFILILEILLVILKNHWDQLEIFCEKIIKKIVGTFFEKFVKNSKEFGLFKKIFGKGILFLVFDYF